MPRHLVRLAMALLLLVLLAACRGDTAGPPATPTEARFGTAVFGSSTFAP